LEGLDSSPAFCHFVREGGIESMSEWFVRRVGLFKSADTGPWTFPHLLAFYQRGKLPAYTLVRQVDGFDWVPIGDTAIWDRLRQETRPKEGPPEPDADRPTPPSIPEASRASPQDIGAQVGAAFLQPTNFIVAGGITLLITAGASSNTNDVGTIFWRFALFYAIVSVVWLPYSIAKTRKHPQRYAIAVLTLFGSWTVILWVLALAWSVTHVESKQS
jgi:hypothetical protein